MSPPRAPAKSCISSRALPTNCQRTAVRTRRAARKPAFNRMARVGAEIRRRFDEWIAHRISPHEPSRPSILAASAAGNLLRICLLPLTSQRAFAACRPRFPPHSPNSLTAADEPLAGAGRLYERHEGGCSRARSAKLSTRFFSSSRSFSSPKRAKPLSRRSLRQQPRIAATIRAAGIEHATAELASPRRRLKLCFRPAGDPSRSGFSRRTRTPPAKRAGPALWRAACARCRWIASSAPDPRRK
jgi:hypothetical protein